MSDVDVAAVFRLLARAPSLTHGVHVAVDGRGRKEYEDFVLARPPRKGETWQTWSARLFGDRPFAIVATGVERFPTEIPSKVAWAVRSWIDTLGLPAGGIDVSLVIGTHGYSPFGAQRDTADGALIHLGPAEKELIVWPSDASGLSGEGHFIDPEEVASSGECFSLRAGSLFFIPAHCYHVARARGLSASLALSLRAQAPGAIARTAMEQLLENSFMDTPETELPFSRVMGRVPNLQRLLRASGLSSASRRPCREWLEQGIEDYRRALLSNGGLMHAPALEEVDAQGLDGAMIRAVTPFPLLWRRERSNIVLFVRRTVRTFAMHPRLPGLIERLNQGERLAVGELVERLGDRWEKEVTLHLLKLLADAGGIEVTHGKRRAR